MGRDKPKKYSKMGYFEKEQWKQDEAKKRGIAGETYTDNRGSIQTRVNEKALKEAIRNDFDYRTSAQHMDGAKGNGKFNDFTNYERAAVKLHKQAGNGGSYSSTKDITGVTNNLVNDYRRDLEDQMSSLDDEQTDTAITPDDNVEYAESQQSKDAKATLDKWMTGLGPGGNLSPYGANSASAPETPSPYGEESSTPVTTDVDEFVSDYKDDVKAAYRFKPTL